METGRVTASGTATDIAADERIQQAYLGCDVQPKAD
jgi:ABC-type branched-subunit amino acid transport system ATPase component